VINPVGDLAPITPIAEMIEEEIVIEVHAP
jgi:hypothetical protein